MVLRVYPENLGFDGLVEVLNPAVIVSMNFCTVVSKILAVFIGDGVLFIRIDNIYDSLMRT